MVLDLDCTDGFHAVIDDAKLGSRARNDAFLGSEHLLLALMGKNSDLAFIILENFGLDRGKVRSAVDYFVGRTGKHYPSDIFPTPHAQKILEYASSEAKRFHSEKVGTLHLLLGILMEEESVAWKVLNQFGVTLPRTLIEISRLGYGPVLEGSPSEKPNTSVPYLREVEPWEEAPTKVLPIVVGFGVLSGIGLLYYFNKRRKRS